MKTLLVMMLVLLAGCTSTKIMEAATEVGQMPEGVDLARCTQYSGATMGGFLGGIDVSADGCQCVVMGDPAPELIEIALEQCSVGGQ